MKVLVTGGAGFIGSNLANTLRVQANDVTVLDNLSLGRRENLDGGVSFCTGDVRESGDLRAAGGGFECIVHLAAASSAPMFEERLIDSYATNVIGFLQVLEFARSIGARKVIYASTSSIYGNNPLPLSEDQQVWPPNFYSVTKHAMEETAEVYHRRYGLELIGFRFMSVYGLREEHKGKFANLVSQFIWAMSGGRPPVIYGDGKQCRDFTNVKDVVRAVVLAMRAEERFGSTVFNVGTQEAYTLIEVADMINAVLGTHIAPQFIENPVKEGYVRQQQADIRKIQRALGFEPQVDLRAGIEEIVAALRAVDKKGCDGLAWVR